MKRLEEAKAHEKAKDVFLAERPVNPEKSRDPLPKLIGSYDYSNGKIGVLVEIELRNGFLWRARPIFLELVLISLYRFAAAAGICKIGRYPVEIIAKEKAFAPKSSLREKAEAIKGK